MISFYDTDLDIWHLEEPKPEPEEYGQEREPVYTETPRGQKSTTITHTPEPKVLAPAPRS
jgi:hypothetical protein